MRINLPNALTLFRMALLPVMVVVFYLPFNGSGVAAALVFLLASITDWLDGWLARRYDQVSAFGAFLDPVADKLMVAITLFLLVQTHPTVLLAITAAIIVGREIAVSAPALRVYHVGEGLLVVAAILTIWSGLAYLRAAWPVLRMDSPGSSPPSQADAAQASRSADGND